MPLLSPKTVSLTSLLLFAAVGAFILVSSKAATPVASREAEVGSISGNATQVTDATASGGSGRG